MASTIQLKNGHTVETLLFRSVCNALRSIGLKKAVNNSDWPGPSALRELWLRCIQSDRKIPAGTPFVLLEISELCDENGNVTENIRNIALSLIETIDGHPYIVIPPTGTGLSPADPMECEFAISLYFR